MEILLGIFIALVLILGYLLWQSKKKPATQDSDGFKLLQDQLFKLHTTLDQKLSESSKNLMQNWQEQTKFTQSSAREYQTKMEDITKKLTEIERTGKDMKTFAEELKHLQNILMNPKQRGILGEYYLEETLKNVLPPNSFEMQYALGKDEGTGKELIVDAVVRVQDKLIPIDSKFSLENYEKVLGATEASDREKWEKLFKQDLKNRIDETSKYIHPDRGTMDFAFMFIPSESVYYDLLVSKVGAVAVNSRDLIEYAFKEKRVIIVSPTSFLAYLQTVLQGLRALQIEESAKAIRSNVEKLGKHLSAYDEYLKKLGNSLGTTVNHYNNASREFTKVDKDILKISGEDRDAIESLPLDQPHHD